MHDLLVLCLAQVPTIQRPMYPCKIKRHANVAVLDNPSLKRQQIPKTCRYFSLEH